MSPNRAARQKKFSAMKAAAEAEGRVWKSGQTSRQHQQSRLYGMGIEKSAHKVGHSGDRSGWNTSLRLAADPRATQCPEYKAWREAVLTRDDHRCVFCGATDELEADHIKPRFIYPELMFNVENGRTLCHPCHAKTETFGTKVKRIVKVDVD